MSKTLAEQAQTYTERALAIVAEVMEDPFAEDRDKLSAAKEMLDRGHGKPTQAVIALPPAQAAREAAAKLSRAELEAIIRNAPLPQLRHESEPIEAEYEEVPAQDPLLK